MLIKQTVYFWTKVVGKSMFPLLNCGSMVCATFCSFQDINIGDVVLFKGSLGYVCHRVFQKLSSEEGRYLKTKGDITWEFDVLVEEKALVGKVVSFKIFGFEIYLNNFFFRWFGIFLGCVTPLIILPYIYFKYFLSRYA